MIFEFIFLHRFIGKDLQAMNALGSNVSRLFSHLRTTIFQNHLCMIIKYHKLHIFMRPSVTLGKTLTTLNKVVTMGLGTPALDSTAMKTGC